MMRNPGADLVISGMRDIPSNGRLSRTDFPLFPLCTLIHLGIHASRWLCLKRMLARYKQK